jgi:cytochrome P450
MTCPAYYDDDLGMWIIADPREVRSVLRDPVTFRPDNALTAHTPLTPRSLRILATVGFALPPTLANNGDAATHLPIRRAVARFFSPARIAKAEQLTRELAQKRLLPVSHDLRAGTTVDLVEAVAAEVPALVMIDLLRIGPVDLVDLKRWSKHSLELFWGWPDPVRQEKLACSAAEFYAWLRENVALARDTPGKDLFSALLALCLSDEEICAAAYFILIAGQETTAQLIAAAYHHLLADPAAWHRVGAEPTLAAEIVKDVLRTRSSVPTWRRVTSRGIAIGAAAIPKGSPLLLRLTGTGAPAELAFGLGVHRCLGAGLAQMETRVALEEATMTLHDIALAETEPPMIDLLSFQAPTRVLVVHA